MASREAYHRVWAQHKGRELSVGLEMREGDFQPAILDNLEEIAMDALVHYQLDQSSAEAAERRLKTEWPGRAYFIEVDSGPDDVRRGVQIFQPWGLPRTNAGTTECP